MKAMYFSKLLFLVMIFCTLSACTETNNEPKLATAPEAKAAYDNTSGGVIKGVMVGSSGVFKFSLKNGNDSIYCAVTFDGVSGKLTTTDLTSWTPGQAISNARFTGKLGATDVVVTLSCAANGSGIIVNFEIAGHFVIATPVKETSTFIVKAYEGTYKTTKVSDKSLVDEGIFNFVVTNNNIYGTRLSTKHNQSRAIKGVITGTSLDIDGMKFLIDDTKISGENALSEGTEKLVVDGKRTL